MQNELGGPYWRLGVNSRPDEARRKKNRKKQSACQTIDLVVAIKTHTESSKSELSSGADVCSKFGDYICSKLCKVRERHASIRPSAPLTPGTDLKNHLVKVFLLVFSKIYGTD